MAKKNKNPEVRFKGFTEDWKHLELGEFLDERKTMQKISEDAPILAFASGQGVIDRSERKSNNRDHLTLDQENKVYKLTELNDIVYNPSNLKYGAIDRNKHGRGVISPIYVTFTTKEEPSFIELIVKSEKFKLRALQYEEGTVVKRQSVSPENLLSLKVGVSNSLDEQKKIGKLFDYIEDLINHHQKKYNKLVILKKAMLVKMFPKNGAVIPEIRFKGFTKDWEKETLSKLGEFKSNGVDKKVISTEHPVNLLNYMDVYNSRYLDANNCKNLMQVTAKDNQLKENNVLKNDVFFTPSSETPEDIGKVMVIENDLPNTVYSYHLMRFRPKLNVFYTYFPNYSFASEHTRKQLVFSAQGVQRYTLSKPAFEEVTVLIPSLEEQKKIGDYFKNIDNQINLHQTQLEKLKNIKKACFSKMFVSQE